MKKKKTRAISWLVVFVMLLSLFPTAALAVEDDIVPQSDVTVSTAADLATAWASACATGGTIRIQGNITVNTNLSTGNTDKDITIIGETGASLTGTDNIFKANGMFCMGGSNGSYSGTLTIQDLKLISESDSTTSDALLNVWSTSNGGADTSAAKIVLQNVTFSSTGNGHKGIGISQPCHVTMNNVTFDNANAGVGPNAHLTGPVYAKGTATISGTMTRAASYIGTLLTVPSGNVTLKNFKLNGSGVSADRNTALLEATGDGKVTLDTGTEITGYKRTDLAHGAVSVNGSSNASVTIKHGAKISGNTAQYGPALQIRGGTAILDGGTITGNTSTSALTNAGYGGAGVYVWNESTHGAKFIMESGSITGNTSAGAGAGVEVYNGEAELKGGSITGNTSQLGGVSVDPTVGNKLTVSGAIQITGNTNKEKEESNVYLGQGQIITVSGLTKDANIGVYTAQPPKAQTGGDVKIATGAKANEAAYFHSDNAKEAGVLYCGGGSHTPEGVTGVYHSSHVSGDLYLSVEARSFENGDSILLKDGENVKTGFTVGGADLVIENPSVPADPGIVVTKAADGSYVDAIVTANNTVKIGDQAYTAGAADITFRVSDTGTVSVWSGSASLADGESITVNGKVIANPGSSGNDTVTVGRNTSSGKGNVTIPAGGKVTIDGVTYTNPSSTGNATLLIPQSGPVELQTGTVTTTDSNVDGAVAKVTGNGDTYTYSASLSSALELAESGDTVEMIPAVNAGLVVTALENNLKAGVILKDNKGNTFTAPDNGSATIAVDNQGKVTLKTGSLTCAPTGNKAASVAVNDGKTPTPDVHTVTGGAGKTFTVTAGEGGKATVGKGESVTIDDIKYTANTETENGTDFPLSGGVNNPGDKAEIGTSGGSVTAADNIKISVPSGNTGSVTVTEGESNTADVLVNNSGDKVIIGTPGTSYTAAKDNTVLHVGEDGDVSIKNGAISLEDGEKFIVAGKEITNPSEEDPAVKGNKVIVSAGDKDKGIAGFVTIKDGGTVEIGGETYGPAPANTEVVYAVKDDGTVVEHSREATLGDNKSTTIFDEPDSVTIANPDQTGSDTIEVDIHGEEGYATVKVPAGTKNSVMVGDKTYTNGSADKDMVLTVKKGDSTTDPATPAGVTLESGSIKLPDDGEIDVEVGASDGKTPVTVKNPADSADSGITVTKNDDGKTADVKVPANGKVEIDGEIYTVGNAETTFTIGEDGSVTLSGGKSDLAKDESIVTAPAGGTATEVRNTGDDGKTVTVEAKDGGTSTITVDESGKVTVGTPGTEYTNPSGDEKMELTVGKDGKVSITDGSVELDKDESIKTGSGDHASDVKNTGDEKIVVKADAPDTTHSTVSIPENGAAEIGGVEVKTDADNTAEVVVDNENGGFKVDIPADKSVTIDGVTYPGGPVTVTVDKDGKVSHTGTLGAVTIDPDNFLDPEYEYVLQPGESAIVGGYVYTAPAEPAPGNSVSLKGSGVSGKPVVELDNGQSVNVALKDKPETSRDYTAAGDDTRFSMTKTESPYDVNDIELLGTDTSSGLHFEGASSVTVNGVTYKGGDDNAKYDVMFGESGQNKVELANNTKVTATFSKPGDSVTTDTDKVNGAKVNEDESTYEDLPFTADSAPSSIVISKDADGKVNVSSGSSTSMTPVKDEDGNIVGYETKRVSGGSSVSSTVKAPKTEHGTVSVDKPYASKDQTVTITIKPDEGYRLGSLTVTDSKGNPVKLKDLGNGKYSFVQPKDAPVTIKAVFVDADSCDRGEHCPAYPFKDLDLYAWYHDGVHYCVENGLMIGIAKDTFAPGHTTTRSMIVTILYRIEGTPSIQESITFLDVPLNQYYTDAVAWASENGIVTGYGNGNFGPNDPITREQMAAMLYRYAQYKGMAAVTLEENLIGFSDHEKVSGYAVQAMNWAVKQRLVEGMGDGTLNPQGNATRAQVATILMRFCENILQ